MGSTPQWGLIENLISFIYNHYTATLSPLNPMAMYDTAKVMYDKAKVMYDNLVKIGGVEYSDEERAFAEKIISTYPEVKVNLDEASEVAALAEKYMKARTAPEITARRWRRNFHHMSCHWVAM